MTREDAGRVGLDALAKIQSNVAMILEAKAVEAEKVRNWLLNHLTLGTFTAHQDQLNASLQFSKMNIQVIDGLAKLCNGLTRNLKTILHPNGEGDDTHGLSSLLGDSDTDGDTT